MSRDEMDQLGWDSCDIILITGDAYVIIQASMAICGRMLEAQGFRVGTTASGVEKKDHLMCFGKVNLFFGETRRHGLMINRYTANCRLRHDDAYTPDNVAGKRRTAPRWLTTQRCKEAWKDVPVIFGGVSQPAPYRGL
ncbi:hypothetical protein ACNKHK_19515 [Shigella flexneri]